MLASITPLTTAAPARQHWFDSLQSGFAALLANTPDMCVVTDATGWVLYANAAVGDSLGHDPANLVGQSVFTLLHPDEALQAWATLTGKPSPDSETRSPTSGRTIEVRMRAADGTHPPAQVAVTDLLDEPSVRGLVLNCRLSTHVDDAHRRFHLLFEQSPVAQALVRAGHPGIAANASFAALFGMTREALADTEPEMLVHPDDRAAMLAALRRLETGEVSRLTAERRYLRENGDLFHGRVAASIMRDAEAELNHILITIEDITEQVTAAEAIARSEARFRALVNNSPDIVAILYPDGEWEASDQGTRLLGYPKGYDPPGGILSLVHPDDLDRAAGALVEILNGTRSVSAPIEVRLRAADGSYRDYECVGQNLGEELHIGGVVINARDVTERKRAERALRAAEERFRVAFEHAPLVVSLVDLDGRIIDINPAGCTLLGRTQSELIGAFAEEAIHPDDRQHAIDMTTRQIGGEDVRVEFRLMNRDGRERWVLSQSSLIDARSEDETAYVLTLQADISASKELEAQLSHHATHDALTDLLNRRAITHYVGQLLQRRDDTSFALMFIDLDGFKSVNDTLGHGAGDEVLRVVAGRIGASIRHSDRCARIGGDEFVIVCERAGKPDELIALATRVRDAICAPVAVSSGEARVDASIGVAIATPDDDVASALHRADVAAYRAKGAGRGRIEVAPVR